MANDANSQLSNGAGSSGSNSSLLSSLGGVVGFASNAASSLLNYHLNRELANQRNQQAIQQWNRENAYNHPREQIKRLKEAGLNPALMYENGASGLVSANSPDMAMSAPANFQGVDPLTAAQIAKLNAETKATTDSNNRENEKQPLSLEKLSKDISSIEQMIAESDSRISLNSSTEFLNNALEGKAREDARSAFYEWQYLKRSMSFRLRDIKNIADTHGFESKKLEIELDSLGDILKQTLSNFRATHNLLVQQGAYYASSAFKAWNEGWNSNRLAKVAETNATTNRMQANNVVHMFNADLNFKIQSLKAQIQRWDDMTTNERLNMVNEFIGNLVGAGSRIYSASIISDSK